MIADFKVGDKVRIKSDVDTDDWSEEMIDIQGKVVTIFKINERHNEYYVEELSKTDGYFYKEELDNLNFLNIFDDKDFTL